MSRPETIDDLPGYKRAGRPVATIHPDALVEYPSLGMHLLAALNEAKRLSLDVADGAITIPKTDEELDEALASAQRLWDDDERRYNERSPLQDTDYWRARLNDWARQNDLPEIDWTEVRSEVTA